MRIAFFGGSFDPPHRGHLAIASAAADRFGLDQVLFAPVASQPLKQLSTSFSHRYAMVALATAADERFIPSLLDSTAADSAPNYTVDTLNRLRARLDQAQPPTELFVLTGADAFLDLARWRSPRQLLTVCDWIVASRPGFSLASVLPMVQGIVGPQLSASRPDTVTILIDQPADPRAGRRIHLLGGLEADISATTLRQGAADPANLPDAVGAYIRKTGLY